MSQETNSAPVTENKMGTMPIGRLVFNMSLPMMISMLVQALYNIWTVFSLQSCPKTHSQQFHLPSLCRHSSSLSQPVQV